jgi:abhydrolase domain-containing protein 17
MGIARRIFRRMSLWLLFLIVLALSYAFFAMFAWFAADGLIFAARHASYTTLPGLIKIPADDGTPIAALHLPNPEARFTILYFHGNAEDLGDIHDRLKELHAHGFAVLSMDYRSYGATPGEPCEANVHTDVVAVYRHAVEKLGVPPDRIIAYGRSLGSGAAVELAASKPVAGLVIQSGFVSAFRCMTGVTLLPWDRFSNLGKIAKVKCPVLIMHGDHDRTIPYAHGQLLLAAANEPKRALWVPGAAHNNFLDVAGERYWEAMKEFRELVERGVGTASM